MLQWRRSLVSHLRIPGTDLTLAKVTVFEPGWEENIEFTRRASPLTGSHRCDYECRVCAADEAE
jgi:hypothetical protein